MDTWRSGAVALVLLLAAAAMSVSVYGQGPEPRSFTNLTTSSSRAISGTVVSTYVVRNGALTLLVLWRGSPGWYYAGGGGVNIGGGGGSVTGRETGFARVSAGGRTLLIEFDYTAGTVTLLGETLSLAETNVILVDQVTASAGARIVERRRIDPAMPSPLRPGTQDGDPAIIAVRRDAALLAFIRCDIEMSFPPGVDTATMDETTRVRLRAYMQTPMTQACEAR